jgi:hypothetical protein
VQIHTIVAVLRLLMSAKLADMSTVPHVTISVYGKSIEAPIDDECFHAIAGHLRGKYATELQWMTKTLGAPDRKGGTY